eukprot:5313461-Amphidinium_carterae.1
MCASSQVDPSVRPDDKIQDIEAQHWLVSDACGRPRYGVEQTTTCLLHLITLSVSPLSLGLVCMSRPGGALCTSRL